MSFYAVKPSVLAREESMRRARQEEFADPVPAMRRDVVPARRKWWRNVGTGCLVFAKVNCCCASVPPFPSSALQTSVLPCGTSFAFLPQHYWSPSHSSRIHAHTLIPAPIELHLASIDRASSPAVSIGIIPFTLRYRLDRKKQHHAPDMRHARHDHDRPIHPPRPLHPAHRP